MRCTPSWRSRWWSPAGALARVRPRRGPTANVPRRRSRSRCSRAHDVEQSRPRLPPGRQSSSGAASGSPGASPPGPRPRCPLGRERRRRRRIARRAAGAVAGGAARTARHRAALRGARHDGHGALPAAAAHRRAGSHGGAALGAQARRRGGDAANRARRGGGSRRARRRARRFWARRTSGARSARRRMEDGGVAARSWEPRRGPPSRVRSNAAGAGLAARVRPRLVRHRAIPSCAGWWRWARLRAPIFECVRFGAAPSGLALWRTAAAAGRPPCATRRCAATHAWRCSRSASACWACCGASRSFAPRRSTPWCPCRSRSRSDIALGRADGPALVAAANGRAAAARRALRRGPAIVDRAAAAGAGL